MVSNAPNVVISAQGAQEIRLGAGHGSMALQEGDTKAAAFHQRQTEAAESFSIGS
jgi:hypothetical protein